MSNILLMDGLEHNGLREEIDRFLGDLDLEDVKRDIRDCACARISSWRTDAAVDLFRDYGSPVVAAALFRALGLPNELDTPLTKQLESLHGALDALAEGSVDQDRTSTKAMFAIAQTLRRDNMSTGGLHRRLVVRALERGMSANVAHFQMAVVLHGGYENPVNMLSLRLFNALGADNAHGDGSLKGDLPALPVRRVIRFASADIPEIGAVRGDKLAVSLLSEDPGLRHKMFGAGSHTCPGRSLGRVMVEGALETFQRLSRHSLVEVGELVLGPITSRAELIVRHL